MHATIPIINESIGSRKEWFTQNDWNLFGLFVAASVSNTTKSTGKLKLLTCTNKTSTIPPRDLH